MYKRPGYIGIMTFQDQKGMANAYQVRQLVNAIEELGLLSDQEADDASS